MDRLVQTLSKKQHKIDFEPQITDLHEIENRIKNLKFAFIRFTDTEGKTEIGINIDESLSDLIQCNFNTGIGKLKIVGDCELNFHKVRCYADIDLKLRHGKGYLEILDENTN